MNHVIGIDGGGTSTVCLLADAEGRVLSQCEAPASNHRKSDLGDARAAISAGIRAVLERATLSDHSPPRVAALCAGLAGVDTETDVALFRRMFADMVLTDHLLVLNDGEIALYGALEAEPGVLVISGTGSIVWATATNGHRLRVGGWDYLLSDEGSGYSVGLGALRAIAAAHDKRVPPTTMMESVYKFLGVKNFEEFIGLVYDGAMTPCRIASLAPLANEAAAAGDAVAVAVISTAAAELVQLTCAAVRLAGLSGTRFPLVVQGGVLRAGGALAGRYFESMRAAEQQVYFAEPRHSPAEGAALLALRMLRQTVPAVEHGERASL